MTNEKLSFKAHYFAQRLKGANRVGGRVPLDQTNLAQAKNSPHGLRVTLRHFVHAELGQRGDALVGAVI